MLELKNLSFAFGSKQVFQGVNMTFEPGKTYGIVGANGVGKTTMFRLIASLYPQQRGSIQWSGNPLEQRQVSFLPTEPFFYPYMNGEEYLRIVLHKEEKQLERALDLSSRFNLPLDQLVDAYSTGMKKKLAFVACRFLDRPINILDEPFSGVDIESNEHLFDLMKEEAKDKLVLVSSHILSTMNELCDEIIYIQKEFKTSTFLPSDFDVLRKRIKGGSKSTSGRDFPFKHE